MQTKTSFFKFSALALAGGLFLAACGGGGGTATVSTGAANPTANNLYAGPIQGFGSVIVNGMRFSSVGSSLVDDDGSSVKLSDLKLGMTVRINGTADDSTARGTATKVELVHGTRGTVTAVDTTNKTITLLGQTVKVNDATVYQGVANLAALAALPANQTVEIYGAVQADGTLLATLVEVKAISAISVSGLVQSLDTTAKTFKVGPTGSQLTVNFNSATVRGTLVDGARVKVKAATNGLTGNVLTATGVQVLGDGFAFGNSLTTGLLLKLKGVAAGVPDSNNIITISGTSVDLSKAKFEGGTSASIAAGTFLEVKGSWDGTKVLATKVEFEGARETASKPGRHELYGAVTSVAGTTAVINGVTVEMAPPAAITGGTLSSVVAGVYVEVHGNVVGNKLVAQTIEIKSGAGASGIAFEQEGLVSNFVSTSDFKVNNLKVNAANATIESKTGSTTIANGTYLEITGKLDANNVFVATKVELK